jgi:hypothetical protein
MEAEILSIVETLDNMPVTVRALLGAQACVECISVCICLLPRGRQRSFRLVAPGRRVSSARKLAFGAGRVAVGAAAFAVGAFLEQLACHRQAPTAPS